MRSVTGVGRIAAVAAVVLAVAFVAVVLFGGGGGYTVTATFVNAGQLVEGNLVQIAGTKAGTVDSIEITEDGQARIGLTVEEDYTPLPNGTRAVIRQASQSGIANRYVELRFPDSSAEAQAGEIDDGGVIPGEDTETAVDLDELFNTLDRDTREALQKFFKGSARQYADQGEAANLAFQYLNPSLAQASRLFNELNRDTPTLNRFILDSATLVTALSERRDALTDLVSNLNTTTRALGSEKAELASAIGRLPDFMRRANTTFVNLRGTLDDLDPLVAASRPVARRLEPFFDELRPFARDARPTVADLNDIVRRRGAGNDLVELTRTFTPLAQIAVDERSRSIDFGTGPADVGETEGAFAETARALRDSAPVIGFGRPYTPDLFGWFDDFSNTGVYDAIGGTSRARIVFNTSTVNLPEFLTPDQLKEAYAANFKIGQYKRCPGGGDVPAADGSNVLSPAEQEALDCSESNRAAGAPLTEGGG